VGCGAETAAHGRGDADRPGFRDPRVVGVGRGPGGLDEGSSTRLYGEAAKESGDACRRRLGPGDLIEDSAEALPVFFAVNGAAEFAIANLSKRPDLLPAI